MDNVAVLRRLFTVFGIALILVGVLIYLYRASFEQFSEDSKSLQRSLTVQEHIEKLLGMIKDTESGTRGYVITDDPSFLMPFNNARLNVPIEIDKLRNLVADNQTQVKLLDTIAALSAKKIEFQNFMIHLKKTGNFKFGHREILNESRLLMDSIRILTAKMRAEESRVRVLRDLEVKESTRYSRILSGVFSFTAVTIMLVSLVSILMEIRSKKRVTDLLRTVLESSRSGIMSFRAKRNVDGTIQDFVFIQINKIGSEILGKPADELEGMSMLSAFGSNIDQPLFHAFVDVTESNTVFRTEKYISRNQVNYWFRIIAVKLDDGFTVTFDDVTNEKRYESELKRSIRDLKRSNSELEQFAFVASHDLQEPLRKIQTFGDRLKSKSQGTLSDDLQVYVDKMLTAARRMSNLISDLLAFSRLARNPDVYTETDMNQVLDDIRSDLEVTINNRKAVIHAGNLPVIEGVKSQLYQLMFNLVGNSLKFSREGVIPEIRIASETFEVKQQNLPEGTSAPVERFARITVADNGIGFDNQFAERIFEIFQRLHGKSEYEGTGIGLAICKRIVLNHRGTISASGKPGEGSVFTIELPLRQKKTVTT